MPMNGAIKWQSSNRNDHWPNRYLIISLFREIVYGQMPSLAEFLLDVLKILPRIFDIGLFQFGRSILNRISDSEKQLDGVNIIVSFMSSLWLTRLLFSQSQT